MEFLRTEGRFITDGDKEVLLRGFGLGGWFLPEGYMWKLYTKCDRPRKMEALIEDLCGTVYAESFWERYLDSYITKEDIDWIAAEGFNSIRLPLNARHLYSRTKNVLSLDQKMFKRIDTLLDWCREKEIYVVLDMHAAPGGQTGQNIDDSENDLPELFMDSSHEEELIFLWKELSLRYKDRPEVAAYDLLNEPLPEFFSQYNDKVLPLYRHLIAEIRRIDPKHIIVLEGVHWASDFSIFEALTKEEAKDNLVLQFHKYWNHPDKESLQEFLKHAERLQVPLYMGEGGENNCDWYTMAFPLYESLKIGWSFWTYKKMECRNSPVTFAMPEKYDELIAYIDQSNAEQRSIEQKSRDQESTDYEGVVHECTLSKVQAIEIFDHLLYCISHPVKNYSVIHALKREVPFSIPAEGYDEWRIVHDKVAGADFRSSDSVTILFNNGKTGKVDYQRMGGEEQPEDENLVILLQEGDAVSYRFTTKEQKVYIEVTAEGVTECTDGTAAEIEINVDDECIAFPIREKEICGAKFENCSAGENMLLLQVSRGACRIDRIRIDKM